MEIREFYDNKILNTCHMMSRDEGKIWLHWIHLNTIGMTYIYTMSVWAHGHQMLIDTSLKIVVSCKTRFYFQITLKFDRSLGSNAAKPPVKIQVD